MPDTPAAPGHTPDDPDIMSRAAPGWRGSNRVATLNGTGFMFEVRDRYADDFIRLAGALRRPVLEIGCAYGVSTIPALEAGGIVTASDNEQGHLDILADKVPPALRARLTLVRAELPGAEFPDSHYAAILCSRVLHFLQGDDVDTAVGKMARWLEPGGQLYLITDTPYGIWRKVIPDFEDARQRGVRWPGMMVGLHHYLPGADPAKPIEKPPFMNVMDPDILARTCREAGLEIVEHGFIPRPDFTGAGRMDDRENCGIIARRPAR